MSFKEVTSLFLSSLYPSSQFWQEISPGDIDTTLLSLGAPFCGNFLSCGGYCDRQSWHSCDAVVGMQKLYGQSDSEILGPFSHGAGDARARSSCAGPSAIIDSFHVARAESTTRAYIFIFITSFIASFHWVSLKLSISAAFPLIVKTPIGSNVA